MMSIFSSIWAGVISFVHGLKIIMSLSSQWGKHRLLYLPVVIALVDVLRHLSMLVTVGYCIFLGRVLEYQEDHLLIVLDPLFLGIGFQVLAPFPAFDLAPFLLSVSCSSMVGVVTVIGIPGSHCVVCLHSGSGTSLPTVIHISVC